MADVSVKKPEQRFMREVPAPAVPPALDAAVSAAVAALPELKAVREAAAGAFRRLGLPHSKTEEFSFLRVAEFVPHLQAMPAQDPWEPPTPEQVKALIFPESQASYLVLVDGVYAPGISHPGPDFQVSLLQEALNPSPR